jgi:hypothetical protein
MQWKQCSEREIPTVTSNACFMQHLKKNLMKLPVARSNIKNTHLQKKNQYLEHKKHILKRIKTSGCKKSKNPHPQHHRSFWNIIALFVETSKQSYCNIKFMQVWREKRCPQDDNIARRNPWQHESRPQHLKSSIATLKKSNATPWIWP